jgi:hypothetical protein
MASERTLQTCADFERGLLGIKLHTIEDDSPREHVSCHERVPPLSPTPSFRGIADLYLRCAARCDAAEATRPSDAAQSQVVRATLLRFRDAHCSRAQCPFANGLGAVGTLCAHGRWRKKK